jgi:hypothetical protein
MTRFVNGSNGYKCGQLHSRDEVLKKKNRNEGDKTKFSRVDPNAGCVWHSSEREAPMALNLKSASGAGYTFEDKVAALLLAEMLVGHQSLGNEFGPLDRIERLALKLNPFDDLLLTTRDKNGAEVQCACSVKSNQQITTKGCNAELRANFWALLRSPVFSGLQNAQIGLFCSQINSDVSSAIHALCLQARNEIPSDHCLADKISSEVQRAVFDSFAASGDTTKAGSSERVLSRFVLREFDFEASVSSSDNHAVSLCRQSLKPVTSADPNPEKLWHELQHIAQNLRVSGGSIDRAVLAEKLRPLLSLTDDPLDQAVWAPVRQKTNMWLSEINNALPDGLVLPRKDLADAILKKVQSQKITILTGQSGSGKSAALKSLFEHTAPDNCEKVWIKAEKCIALTDETPAFVDTLKRTRKPTGIFVIDALDGCFDPVAFARIASVIQGLNISETSPWRVVLTCQTMELPRIQQQLAGKLPAILPRETMVTCNDLSEDDMNLVFSKHPHIGQMIWKSPALAPVLHNPKILDLVLRGTITENCSIADEADIADWWWNEQVKGGQAFAVEESVLTDLAERMAETFSSEVVPKSDPNHVQSLNRLIKTGVLRTTPEGRVRFGHDLFADWTRVRRIHPLDTTAAAVFLREHIENPLWLRAIRIHSIRLLGKVESLPQWKDLVAQCWLSDVKGCDGKDLQLLNTLLEGIIYSRTIDSILNLIATELFENDGRLIRAFIAHLLWVGTQPDTFAIAQITKLGADCVGYSSEELERSFRIPSHALWTGIIPFLNNHIEQVLKFVPVELAEIGQLWSKLNGYLSSAGYEDLPEWKQLASLLVSDGELELRLEIARKYRHDDNHRNTRVLIYSTALAAVQQCPDRVKKLALKAAGRMDWEVGDLPVEFDPAWIGEWRSHGSWLTYDTVALPVSSWPDGPHRCVSRDFAKAWMQAGAALPFFKRFPQEACEVTLALLIDWPKRSVPDRRSSQCDHFGFSYNDLVVFPAFWTKGPFILLLRENPLPALRLIIQLVNFATERYSDWWPYQDKAVCQIEFNANSKKVVWLGNLQVYAWNRYPMNTQDYVGCALMALERWFDVTVKKNATVVSAAINQIFEQGQSLAFAGVLVNVGKRHRELFLTGLKPLFFIESLLYLDIQTVTQESSFGGGGFNETLFERKLQAEWYQIPERKQTLSDLCAKWMFEDSRFIPVLKEVSDNWRTKALELPTQDEQVTLLRWATFFDFTSYKAFKMPDGQVVFQCQLPPELDRTKEAQQSLLNSNKLILPFQCYQQLENRLPLNDKQFDEHWQRLLDWKATFAESYDQQDASNIEDRTTDPRHAHAGLLALLVCLGEEQLKKNPARHDEVVNEVKVLLSNPPQLIIFSEEEHHDDFEAFMARIVVHLWVEEPKCKIWRKAVAEYATAYRYRTPWHLYNEAFRLRASSGTTFHELEALILAFANVRQRISLQPPRQRDYKGNKDRQRLVSDFAKGKRPAWSDEWDRLYVVGSALPATRGDRSTYRLDMTLLLHTLGHMDSIHITSCKNIPSLSEAYDIRERRHWINHAVQMVSALVCSIPESFEESASKPLLYEEDRNILYLAAIRLLECSDEERQSILAPLLNNPVAEVISALLDGVSLARYHAEPPLMKEVLAVWETIVFSVYEHQTAIRYADKRHRHDIWRTALLYQASCFRFSQEDEMTALTPLVTALKPIYHWFINEKLLMWDAHEISSLALFLSTKAGKDIQKDVVSWFERKLSKADARFWEKVSNHDGLPKLLQSFWAQDYAMIRHDTTVRKAFTALLTPLVANHNRLALTVQQQLPI